MKLICGNQTRKRLIRRFTLGFFVAMSSIVAVLSVPAFGDQVLFDTGFSQSVLFNGNASNLGWTSGNNSGGGQPQRWTAQAFSLSGTVTVTQINAEYFNSIGNPTDIGIMIWNRTGENAPTDADEVFSGMVTNPGGENDTWSELSLGSGVVLGSGDYYLSVFGVDPTGADATIGWFTGAPDGINFLDSSDNPWMWRSSTYPAPGFEFYQLPLNVLAADQGDPRDTYNAAFQIIGRVPEPGSMVLLGIGALVTVVRRRR